MGCREPCSLSTERISIGGTNFIKFSTRVGFRQAEFTADGFLLNGKTETARY